MRLAFLIAIFLICIGCGPSSHLGKDWEKNYRSVILSAKTSLPIAVQMEEVFPVADHFITNYGFDDKPKLWNTEVFFGGRFILTMQVYVNIDYNTGKIMDTCTEPIFYLSDADKVEILADGRAEMFYNGANQREFGLKGWKSLYDAHGDLSVLGIQVNQRPVANFDEEIRQTRRDRLHVSLLKTK